MKSSGGQLPLYMKLLGDLEAGKLQNLDCPTCHLPEVNVWFTQPVKDTYRTWFICGTCGFHNHAQNSERPRFYSEDLRRQDLEVRDLVIIQQAKFKKPVA